MSLPSNKAADVFTVHQEEPLNAEPVASELVQDWKTPRDLQYLRNHGEILHIDRESYELHFDVDEELREALSGSKRQSSDKSQSPLDASESINLETLRHIGTTTLAAALQCAGNRRSEMDDRHEVEGIKWGPGTILNAEWSGTLLRDLLRRLGVPSDITRHRRLAEAHVHFTSRQKCEQADEYQASISLKDAMDPERCVILAYAMNGTPLPDEHGGPLRVVVPGFVGARSVKWLHSISLQSKPSDNFYMTSDYKKLPSFVDADHKAEWMEKTRPLQETGLQSAIGRVDKQQPDGRYSVQGYAFNGDGTPIAKVQVCTLLLVDGPETSQEDIVSKAVASGNWTDAELDQETRQDGAKSHKVWSWTLWRVEVKSPLEEHSGDNSNVVFVCRAVATDGQEQEKTTEWNVRGVENEGYHVYRL